MSGNQFNGINNHEMSVKIDEQHNGIANIVKEHEEQTLVANKPQQSQLLNFHHKRTERRVELAKRKARSELQKCGWQNIGYAFGKQSNLSGMELDTIERVDATRMSYTEFVDRFERAYKPVILIGITDQWRANDHWNLQTLKRGYRNQKFKCGEDDDGYSVKLKMKYYLDYMCRTQDDSPLYIFDSSFGDRSKTAKLLADYEVPSMFRDDLFQYATEGRRPPYRWFVMGPARSGTSIHIDPLGTSAWNALILGHKKWCLIHPSAPKYLLKPTKEESGVHPDEAITWFNTVYHRVCSSEWPVDKYPVIHAIQRAGEVMFVPSGWWHVVMNLDTTIAVTQNFCSITNLPKVWPRTVRSRPQFALHWLKAVQKARSELLPLIEAINRQNGIRPLDISEPCDSSSSSSSSDDSSSESEDDGFGDFQQNNKIIKSNTNNQTGHLLIPKQHQQQQQQQAVGGGIACREKRAANDKVEPSPPFSNSGHHNHHHHHHRDPSAGDEGSRKRKHSPPQSRRLPVQE